MKSWLLKFKISNALNDGRPLAPALKNALTQSDELRRFEENSSALAHALKSQLPNPRVSGPLHASIMRAVRTAHHAAVAENQSAWPRWIPVSAAAVLVLCGALLVFEFSNNPSSKVQPADSQALAAASAAMEAVGSLVREAPAAAWSPLADEMQRLDRDLVKTKHFLFASLP